MNTRELVRTIQQTKLIIAVAGTLAILPTGAAVAQQTQAPSQAGAAPAATSPSPTASPAAPGQSETVERIIVTATKREEDIQKAPASISAIEDTQLDNLHATQLTDYAGYIQGLQVNGNGSPGQVFVILRGLSPISSGATVSTYINDVPTGSSGIYQRATQFELDLLPYDLRRVEVLRGPQGTLWGANSMGGLLRYVTLDPTLSTPTFQFGGGISGVTGSNQAGWDVHANVDIPLVTDHLGIRVSYARNQLPGFIDNVVNGEKDINSATQQSALVALLWRPNDDVGVRFNALWQDIDSKNSATVALDPVTEQPLYGNLKNAVYVNEPFTKKIVLLELTVDINLGWADFTSATGYSHTETNQVTDGTTTYGQAPLLVGSDATGIAPFGLDLNLDKFSQELRLTSKTGERFEWQVGAFFTYEDAANTQSLFLRQLDGTKFTGPLAILNTLAVIEIPSTYTEYAGFANGTYHFTDQWSLGAGLRYSHDSQDFSQNVVDGIVLPIANTPGSSEEDIWNFMVTPQFQIDKDKLLYVRIASGYQPGGPNVALPGVPPSVGPTTNTSYEIGLKTEFDDHRLLFNITGFYVNLSNIQVGTLVNNVSALVNAGTANSNGLEFNAQYTPITGLQFGANGAYTNATLTEDAPSISGLAGDRLPFVPLFSASLTADYYFPLPWGSHSETVAVASEDGKTTVPHTTIQSGGWNGHVGAGFRWVGQNYSQVTSSPTAYRQGAYGMFDLNADVSNRHCTVRVFARNLANNGAYQTVTPITNLFGAVDHLAAVPVQPRTFGLEVDFKF